MEKLTLKLDEYKQISRSERIFNVILGFALVIFSGIGIYKSISEGKNIGSYLIFLLLVIFGINVLLYTFGIFYRFSRRYVFIDNQGIEYKLSYLYPSKTIAWKDIRKIEIRILRIFFHKKGGSTSRMKLGEIFFKDIKKIKKALADAAAQKGIELSDTTLDLHPDPDKYGYFN